MRERIGKGERESETGYYRKPVLYSRREGEEERVD